MTRLDAQESLAFADRVRLPLLFDAAAMAADLCRSRATGLTHTSHQLDSRRRTDGEALSGLPP